MPPDRVPTPEPAVIGEDKSKIYIDKSREHVILILE
jgi:hypothetical protein